MVNRTMEAKRIKYIRQSKARPRTLRMNHGYQRVPQSIDRSKIPKEYEGLFEYRKHAYSSSLEDFLNAKFPSHLQESSDRRAAVAASGRAEPPTTLKTMLQDGKYTKMVMFSDTRLTCFYFVEFQPLLGLIRESVTYGSHSRALMVFQQKTIRWKEVIQIPNVETTPLV